MKVTIKSILESEQKTSKEGKPYTVTTFVGSDGEVYKNIFGKFSEGQEIEGEWQDHPTFGRQFKVSQAPRAGGFSGGKNHTDPNTMLIAYAKDVVVAFIAAGVVKDSKAALVGLDAFTAKMFDLYNGKKAAKEAPKEAPKPAIDWEERAAEAAAHAASKDPEIDLSDIDF